MKERKHLDPQKNLSMNCKISYTDTFAKSLKRLSKHYRSLKEDYVHFLASLKENPFDGVDLGMGLRKVRMAITSKGKGKSGGARVITYQISQIGDEVQILLMDIYDKSEKETMTDKELRDLLKRNNL